MSQTLAGMGHEVEVYTRELGEFARKFRCPITDDVDSLEEYDLLLVNHLTCWDDVKGIPGKRIFTSHSIVVDIEQYPPDAAIRVAATAEVAEKMGGTYIPNGIDTSQFKPMRPLNPTPEVFLYLGKSNIFKGFDAIKEAVGDKRLITPNGALVTPELISEADVVFGYGRAALEGMACGCNVISADCRIYMSQSEVIGGGMITEDNVDRLALHNFTGRGKPQTFDADALKAEIDKYDPSRDLSGFIRDNYSIQRTVQKYLSLATEQVVNEGYYA